MAIGNWHEQPRSSSGSRSNYRGAGYLGTSPSRGNPSRAGSSVRPLPFREALRLGTFIRMGVELRWLRQARYGPVTPRRRATSQECAAGANAGGCGGGS
eukprot:12979733-Alexandrium_andersonii.AAC.1